MNEREGDLIPISEASRILNRKLDALRIWAARGAAPNGMRLRVYRDSATLRRMFPREDVERIAASLVRPDR